MANRKGDYFGLSYIVSVILAIIPITSWVLGMVTRLVKDGKPIAFLLRLLLGWNIIWLLDLVFMIVQRSICRLIDC